MKFASVTDDIAFRKIFGDENKRGRLTAESHVLMLKE